MGDPIGHNQGPALDVDAIRARLAEDNAALLDRGVDLELETAKLPADVTSDAHVQAIADWVVRSRTFIRDVEAARKSEKDFFLAGGRAVDGFFGSVIAGADDRAKQIANRSAPYLRAKAEAERLERERAAAAARAAEEEQRRLAQEAADRRAAAEREADAARDRLAEAATAEERKRAFEEVREAESTAISADREMDIADRSALDASRAGRRAEREVRSGLDLSRTTGASAAAKVKTEWEPRVASWDQLRTTLGPLGPYLNDSMILDALRRARDVRPPIAGVEWIETTAVKTTALRRGT